VSRRGAWAIVENHVLRKVASQRWTLRNAQDRLSDRERGALTRCRISGLVDVHDGVLALTGRGIGRLTTTDQTLLRLGWKA